MSQATIAGKEKQNEDPFDQIWLQPLKYIMEIPDEVAQAPTKAGISVFKIPEDKFIEAETIMRNVYFGSLLLDDIQDKSTVRGGIPVAHSVYGVPSAMNSFFYAFLNSTKRILNYHPDALMVFIQEIPQILTGQETEMQWENTLTCPTEEEFFTMVDQKTGSLVRALVGLLQLYGENKADFSRLCRLLGRYMQVVNDYKNYKVDHYIAIKGYAEDLSAGKYTLPIIHAVANYPKEGQEILSILHQRTHDMELKKHCVDLLAKCGSFEYNVAFLKKLRNEIVSEMEKADADHADAVAIATDVLDFWARKIF